MEADIGQIKRSLQLLFQEGDTIELRCVGNQTINGFYRDPDKLAQDAHHLNSALHPPWNLKASGCGQYNMSSPPFVSDTKRTYAS